MCEDGYVPFEPRTGGRLAAPCTETVQAILTLHTVRYVVYRKGDAPVVLPCAERRSKDSDSAVVCSDPHMVCVYAIA